MRAKITAGILAAGVTVGLACAAHASPVAMASTMVGKPVYRSGSGAWKPLGVLTRLSPGDEVKCAPGQQAVIMMFTNGVRFRVASGKTGTVEPTAVRGADQVGGMGGATIRVAKAMTGLDAQPFLARPGHSFARLNSNSPGIEIYGEKSITWSDPDTGVASCIFTLFNQTDNVIWSTHVTGNTADLTQDPPALSPRKPYVWTLTELGASGKPIAGRWGIVTFLTQADSDQLLADVKSFKDQFAAAPTDYSPILLEAEAYRTYGVLNGTLEALQDAEPSGQPGIKQDEEDVFAQVSQYAVLLHKLDSGRTITDSTDTARQ